MNVRVAIDALGQSPICDDAAEVEIEKFAEDEDPTDLQVVLELDGDEWRHVTLALDTAEAQALVEEIAAETWSVAEPRNRQPQP